MYRYNEFLYKKCFTETRKKKKNIVINEELHTEPCKGQCGARSKDWSMQTNREYVKHAKASNLESRN
jgi:hypothetical protein